MISTTRWSGKSRYFTRAEKHFVVPVGTRKPSRLFAVVVPETDHGAALKLGEECRAIVADEPFDCEGRVVEVTISIGVATLEGEEIEPEAFLKRADDKLYEAKRAGRNQVAG